MNTIFQNKQQVIIFRLIKNSQTKHFLLFKKFLNLFLQRIVFLNNTDTEAKLRLASLGHRATH